MSEIRAKLLKAGFPWPEIPQAVGAYVPAVQTGSLVFISGQLPVQKGKLLYTGRVGRELELEQARLAAALCFVNCLAALQTLQLEPERIKRVIRITGHVQCVENFTDQPLVLNGASELCLSLFGESGKHSRAALGAYSLPLNAAVELEAIFEMHLTP